MKNIIYALADPRNDLIYYVGKSTVGMDRPLTHLTNSHSEKVNQWVKSLNEKWLYPKIIVLENVEFLDDLPNREEYWINYYYGINSDLLNTQLKINENKKYFLCENEQFNFDVISRNVGNIHVLMKNQRIARNITQEEISKMMNCSRSTVSLFERGENVVLSVLQSYNLALRAIEMKKLTTNLQRVRK